MGSAINFSGVVDWSGENPTLSYKDKPDGNWISLASFFRIVVSPFGQGHALVLMQSPNEANPPSERANYCFYDNEKLARFLVTDFVAHFGTYRGLAGLTNLTYRKLDSVASSGDPGSTYHETVRSGDLTVQLTWRDLGKAFCFALPPEQSPTGKHHLPCLFIGCKESAITVNGKPLPGKPVPREIAGHKIDTALLAFSETWIRADIQK